MAIYLLGGHQSDFARAWSREGLDLSDILRDGILGALDACKLDASDIDAVHVGNAFGELYRGQGHLAAMVAQVVPELHGVPAMRHEAACASASIAVLTATAEIEAGRYDCVLIVGAEEEKNLPGDEASKVQNAASWQGREGIDCRFMWPAVFGRLSQEYGERYGLDRRHLNRIAEINLTNAKRNPLSQTRKWAFTPENFTDDDAANPIIEPGTRRMDCGQITDGTSAIVLCSDRFMERYAARRGVKASDFPQILGWGHTNAGIRFLDKIERSKGQDYIFPHVRKAITDAWGRAGIAGPQDLSGVETHDCFTSTEYMAIDHLGLTAPGQSWQAVESGLIELGGKCPVNASGGLIGVGHPVGATGARMLLDAGRQVTGTAGDYQVEGARTYQTLNIGGSLGTVVSFVVGRAG
ncbi:MAG: acetyl-CoA acetyltransferase [Phenylobacterium sp.]|uniref:acetyl-CoA acetyltransferase n=1 Tax=Phenylobacterium sp. TaxID=1871053 RepID=UPI0025EBACE8|nr:acetyl-CoA acetyltransferase [Phenylobacterium sp.]MBA4011071.1 acetyl-CoA acetyltransferase [Phenylobacterium sp.]